MSGHEDLFALWDEYCRVPDDQGRRLYSLVFRIWADGQQRLKGKTELSDADRWLLRLIGRCDVLLELYGSGDLRLIQKGEQSVDSARSAGRARVAISKRREHRAKALHRRYNGVRSMEVYGKIASDLHAEELQENPEAKPISVRAVRRYLA